MKKVFLILVFCVSLVSCSKSDSSKIFAFENYNYENFENSKITAKSIFNQQNANYFVYIYQTHCGHCNNLKKYVFQCLIEERMIMYLCEYTKEIALCKNYEEGARVITKDDFCIPGVPALIEVYENEVKNYYFGENKISSFLIEELND